METYVLDASSLLRFLLAETGGLRVKAILEEGQNGSAQVKISSVNWGEVVGKIYKSKGLAIARDLKVTFQHYGLQIVSITAEHAESAARLKVERSIPYADAIAIAFAMTQPNALLVTADYDFLPAADLLRIEFLPAKAKP